MFVTFGLEKFLPNYVGMSQMHHLKEKYFSVILRKDKDGLMQIMPMNLVQKFKHNLNRSL